MSTFTPQGVDRRRCAQCGIQQRFHHLDGGCPSLYRPTTLVDAHRTLAVARAAGDRAAEFVARGEVQRLGGDPAEATK